ncbi:hypothetical protein RvY_18187 [Ramazzottius varieornatus]|uniref:Uncharacterized protein n=1 Tax=Ramazzottius varieornatus TaxID=947166 RepID=A0A1D1W4U5_RAMVA|nr:hypothetical protein RvY_18187 [Ramazzottius varieornatus]
MDKLLIAAEGLAPAIVTEIAPFGKQVDSDVTDSEPEKTVEERNGQRHYCASSEVNQRKWKRMRGCWPWMIKSPYQYPPGKECTLAWKVALRHSSGNTYQPTESELMPETEKENKTQKKKDVDALHSLRVLVDRKVKEFNEKCPKRTREFGDDVNIVDQVIQSLAEKKDNQPSAVPKAD